MRDQTPETNPTSGLWGQGLGCLNTELCESWPSIFWSNSCTLEGKLHVYASIASATAPPHHTQAKPQNMTELRRCLKSNSAEVLLNKETSSVLQGPSSEGSTAYISLSFGFHSPGLDRGLVGKSSFLPRSSTLSAAFSHSR